MIEINNQRLLAYLQAVREIAVAHALACYSPGKHVNKLPIISDDYQDYHTLTLALLTSHACSSVWATRVVHLRVPRVCEVHPDHHLPKQVNVADVKDRLTPLSQ